MAIAKIRAIVPKAIDVRLQRTNVKGIVWTDNKGLHDTIQKDGVHGKLEKRAALELAVIKDNLEAAEIECRWLPHQLNVSDVLTKTGGHGEELQRLLQSCRIRFRVPENVLEERAQERAAQGFNSRPKRSGATLASAANAEMDG
eukprot:1833192-Amphidinium_carterae.1